jgi:hypothetical protein
MTASALSDHPFDYLMREVIPKYRDGMAEEQHYSQIDNLIVRANDAGSRVLGELGYKYGVAQKLLNLFLNYLWARHNCRAASLPCGPDHHGQGQLQG